MNPRLQVLVSTYGADGIARAAAAPRPFVSGVEYLISWQRGGAPFEIPPPLRRPDVRVVESPGRGLSRNRNHSLQASSAPLLLISDDDVEYTADSLRRIIELFDSNPDADVITFRYEPHPDYPKFYPAEQFSLDRPPAGYYVTSFELALRRTPATERLRFNEWFGIGAPRFTVGEEDILMDDIRRAGIRGRFVPETLAAHRHATSTDRAPLAPAAVQAKGAVLLRCRPLTWLPAICVHALRSGRPVFFFRHAMEGVIYAWKHHIFTSRT